MVRFAASPKSFWFQVEKHCEQIDISLETFARDMSWEANNTMARALFYLRCLRHTARP